MFTSKQNPVLVAFRESLGGLFHAPELAAVWLAFGGYKFSEVGETREHEDHAKRVLELLVVVYGKKEEG